MKKSNGNEILTTLQNLRMKIALHDLNDWLSSKIDNYYSEEAQECIKWALQEDKDEISQTAEKLKKLRKLLKEWERQKPLIDSDNESEASDAAAYGESRTWNELANMAVEILPILLGADKKSH